jgi:hypothetical protein
LGLVQACKGKTRQQVDKPTGYVRNPTSDFFSIFFEVRIDFQDSFLRSFFSGTRETSTQERKFFVILLMVINLSIQRTFITSYETQCGKAKEAALLA